MPGTKVDIILNLINVFMHQLLIIKVFRIYTVTRAFAILLKTQGTILWLAT